MGLACLSRAHPALRAAILEAEGRWYVAATEQAGGGGGGGDGDSDGRGRDEKLAAALGAVFGGSGGSDGGDGGGGGNGGDCGKACPAAVGEGAPHSAAAWVALLRKHGVAAVELCSLATLRERHLLPRLQLHGTSFQFLRAEDHPIGAALTSFAPLAIRPRHTPLTVPQPHAPAYGAHTKQVLAEVGVEAEQLLARGVAAERWSLTYLPGRLPPPPPPPAERAAAAAVAAVAEAAVAAVAAVATSAKRAGATEAEACPICLNEITRGVQLGCGHSLCGGCALSCGDAGHRRCPVCRTPHLLHPARLAQRSHVWRTRYASWRVGGAAGARGELSSIRVPAAAEAARRAEKGGISSISGEEIEVGSTSGAGGGTSGHGGVGHSRQCGDVHRASMSACVVYSAPDLVKLERDERGRSLLSGRAEE